MITNYLLDETEKSLRLAQEVPIV